MTNSYGKKYLEVSQGSVPDLDPLSILCQTFDDNCIDESVVYNTTLHEFVYNFA